MSGECNKSSVRYKVRVKHLLVGTGNGRQARAHNGTVEWDKYSDNRYRTQLMPSRTGDSRPSIQIEQRDSTDSCEAHVHGMPFKVRFGPCIRSEVDVTVRRRERE